VGRHSAAARACTGFARGYSRTRRNGNAPLSGRGRFVGEGSMHRKFSLVAVLATILLAGCGSLSSNELKDSVGTIHSAVQEGAILAGDAAKGRTTTNFVRAYAGQLSSALQHETEKLTDAKPAQGV